MSATHGYVIIVSLATAMVFFVLAASLAARAVRSDDARLANSAFSLWWFTLGVQNVVVAVRLGAGLADAPLSLVMGLQFVTVAAVTSGLAGLLVYLVYLITGRAVATLPMFLAYSLYAGWLVAYFGGRLPLGYEVTRWSVAIAYAGEATEVASLTLLLILVGPQLVAIVALLVVAARLPHSASRLRVLVVALSIALWFSSAVLADLAGLTGDAWQATRVLIPLAVGLAVLIVHRPPAWLRRRMPPEIESPEPTEEPPPVLLTR
jgi:hypothetical protein